MLGIEEECGRGRGRLRLKTHVRSRRGSVVEAGVGSGGRRTRFFEPFSSPKTRRVSQFISLIVGSGGSTLVQRPLDSNRRIRSNW